MKPLTHSSTAKQEEKQEERGSCQTLGTAQKRISKYVIWEVIMHDP